MRIERDRVIWLAAGLAIGGVVWLAPLMVNQMTFFGDRDQEADAAAARALMVWPAILLAAAAGLLAVRGRGTHAALTAAPLLSVGLALALPGPLYQLLAYGITAPVCVGASVAAFIPLDTSVQRPVLLTIIFLTAFFAVTATPFAAGMGALMLLAWWGLSRRDRR